MEELKTLKDLTYIFEFGEEDNGLKELKAEAIKWVKMAKRMSFSEKDFLGYMMKFLNLTEEDLK